jgi:hypothetical protein
LSDSPSGSESSLVSQHSNTYLVDKMVMSMHSSTETTSIFGSDVSFDHVVSHRVQPMTASMQYSTDTTPIFGGDASLDLVVSHPIQPMVEEVVVLMQSSTDPTLLLESDKYKEVTLPMKSSVNPTLLLGGDASFDHVFSISSLVPSEQGIIPLSLSTLPPSPRTISFDWNDFIEPQIPSLQVSSAIILSSVWNFLGSPKIVSTTSVFPDPDRSPTWDLCPPL